MKFCNKLECLSLPSLLSLIWCLQVRQEPTKVKTPFRCSTMGQVPDLANKQYTRLKRLGRSKHSSLLRKLTTYDCKKIYYIGSQSLCYKTFYGRNILDIVIKQGVCHTQNVSHYGAFPNGVYYGAPHCGQAHGQAHLG